MDETPSTQNGNITSEDTVSSFWVKSKEVICGRCMGNVQIELESSTNLLTWAAFTNAINRNDLSFFRVKLRKLNP